MNTELCIPPPVRAGGHIRIVSPASATAALLPERARRGEAVLTALGFEVSYGTYALEVSDDGATAGSAARRASDFMAAFEDPGVDAVLAADAGDGTRDLLEFLDPALLVANPKPFIGYCDNVFLHQYLASHAGMSSLYGCTLMSHLGEAGGAFPETLANLTSALAHQAPLVCEPTGDRTGEFVNWHLPGAESRVRSRCVRGGWTWLRRGRATGRLLGGEIRLVPALVDLFGLSLQSAVLFWHLAFRGPEPEPAFRNLCSAVDLTGLAGMIVGAHPTIPPPEWAARVSDLLDEMLPGIDYPVVVNADLSHLDPAWTVPYGEPVTVDSSGRIAFWRGQRPGAAE